MRQFLIFVALCAVCTAAPAPADIIETEVSTVRAIAEVLEGLLKTTAKPIGPEVVEVESTKPKRESPEKPASPTGHEAVQHDAHADNHDAGKPDHAEVPETAHQESTKPKRESPAKPAHDEPAVPEYLIPLIEPVDNKTARHQRDIPVPTQVKTTAAPNGEQEKPQEEDVNAHVPEEGSSTCHSTLLHHPVTIDEQGNQVPITSLIC